MKGMNSTCFFSLQKVQQGLSRMGSWASRAACTERSCSSLETKQSVPGLASAAASCLKCLGLTLWPLWLYSQTKSSSILRSRKYSSLRKQGESRGFTSFLSRTFDLVVMKLLSCDSSLKKNWRLALVSLLYQSAMTLRRSILLFCARQWQSCSLVTWRRKTLELRLGVMVMAQRLGRGMRRLISYLFWKLMNFLMKVRMMFSDLRILRMAWLVTTRIRCWHFPSLLYLKMFVENTTSSFPSSRHCSFGSAFRRSASCSHSTLSLSYIPNPIELSSKPSNSPTPPTISPILHPLHCSMLQPTRLASAHNKFIMEGGEDEITVLLKKIEQQEEAISKLRSEQGKLANYVREFREAIDKKASREMESSKAGVDEEKVEKQLEKELDNAKLMLRNYQNELKNLTKKNTKNKFTADDLLAMEDALKTKDALLKQLHEDIKNLTIVRRKQEKLIDKREKNEDGLRLTKIVDEIRKQREVLEALKAKHALKQSALEKRKAAIAELEKQYVEKCQKYGEKPLNFEQFKEKRLQKRREESVSKLPADKKDPKKHLSIKDIINAHLDIENVEVSEKSLAELREKKAVAENSLKTTRKKFEKETEELEERLGVLRRENESLHCKYLEKKKEKEVVETARTIDFKKNSSKTMRKLEPIK